MGITTTGRVGPHFALTVTQASLDLAAAITREGVDIDDKGRIMPLVATMPSGVKISIEIPESELDTASQSAIKGLRDGSVQTDLFEGRPDYVKRASSGLAFFSASAPCSPSRSSLTSTART